MLLLLFLAEKAPLIKSDIKKSVNESSRERYKVINNNWRKVGSCLGLTPNQLDGIQTDKGCQDDRLSAVMDHWKCNCNGLPHGEKYPYAYKGLHALLKDSGLSKYAKEFMSFLKLF